jgi:hypothetical protein
LKQPRSNSLAVLLTLGGVWLGTACGPTLRIEPVVGDEASSVTRIQKEWDDDGAARACEALLESFKTHWREGRSQEAWALLSPGFRADWMAASKALGLDGEKLFAQGLLPRGDMPSWDPVATLAGSAPFYVTGPAPELNVKDDSNRRLFWVVQQDGSQVSLAVVKQGGKRYLDPKLGLGEATVGTDR